MSYEFSKTKLKEYFSTITYIDDKFDHYIIDKPLAAEPSETEEVPLSLELGEGEVDEATPIPENAADIQTETNLTQILIALNSDEYIGVRFNPVLFSETLNKDLLVEKIRKSPLTIIDWDLGVRSNAFEIINQLFQQTKQLKVLVVYTNNYVGAEKAFKEDATLSASTEIITPYDSFSCYRCNHQSLLVIASKQNYNLQKFLEIVPELFVENCGLLPVALLDYMNAAQNVSDDLFGAFSRPFADLYFLQMYYSELSDSDVPASLASFIQNKFQESLKIDDNIAHELLEHQRAQLEAFTSQSDEEAYELIQTSLRAIRPHLAKKHSVICDMMLKIEYEQYKACFKTAVENPFTWENALSKFMPLLDQASEMAAQKKCFDLFAPYADVSVEGKTEEKLQAHKTSVIKKIKEKTKDDYSSFQKQILPVFIQLLISAPDILCSGYELVHNLKYRNYSSEKLVDVLAGGRGLGKKPLSAFLKNKLHFGDILIKSDTGTNEYLLCILPPCDVFRPEKTDCNILYIRGTELDKSTLTNVRKESEHISILPIKDVSGCKLKYVCWKFFDIEKFNMCVPEEYDRLCSYSRPLIMSEQYVRQIANKYTAYFSRAGVDEIFMKQEPLLRRMFE